MLFQETAAFPRTIGRIGFVCLLAVAACAKPQSVSVTKDTDLEALLAKHGGTFARDQGAVTGARIYCELEYRPGAITFRTHIENSQSVPQVDWDRFWAAAKAIDADMREVKYDCTDSVKESLRSMSP